jgi:hypothetical protein
MPTNIDFIVRGRAAASMLGLTDSNAFPEVYLSENSKFYQDKVKVVRVTSLSAIPFIESGKRRIKITSPGRTVSDLINDNGISDGMTVEAIAKLLCNCDIGRWNRVMVEKDIEAAGAWDKYCEVIPEAEAYFDY